MTGFLTNRRNDSMHIGLRAAILGFSLVAIIAGTAHFTGCNLQPGIGYNQGYQPKQPIPYSHALHVGQLGMQCQYCHTQVEVSKHANIPTPQSCMNCHIIVKTDSPHIQKLREAYDKGESIEWVRVHMLPDHARFNHAAHVTSGVSCTTCHGPIDKMEEVYQYSNLSMGWCVNCHRQPENNAPLNCSTCHY